MKQLLYIIAAGIVVSIFLIPEKTEPARPIIYQTSPAPSEPERFQITPVVIDRYLTLDEVNSTMKRWNQEAPQITEFGTVGSTNQNRAINYLKIGKSGPKILIHAAIHGNERIPTSCTLFMMNQMLSEYGRDEAMTKLLKTRQIYFVPVLSVDSYVANKRHAEGVDPNRNYPCPENPNQVSISPLRAIQKFHAQHKFAGVISGHSFGRVYLYPRFGPDVTAIKSLGDEMGKISGYGVRSVGGGYPSRNAQNRGYDVDWYYWSGSVSLLTEFGQGSHNMNPNLLKSEAERNYKAFTLFIEKAPNMKLIGFKSSGYRHRAQTDRRRRRPGA